MNLWLVATFLAFGAEFGPTLDGEWLATDAPAEEDSGGFGCSDQYLRDGIQLPDLPLFYRRGNTDNEWGSREMVNLLVDAGRHMSWLMPGASPFLVGDISRERGGYNAGHITHRGGVDADVGIYAKRAHQNPRGFMTLAPSELDVEATWALMSTFLDSGLVDFILIDEGHIRVLRAYTLRAGLLTEEEAARVFPPDGVRYWEYTGIVRHAPNHRDHMHVRVLCGDGTRAGG